jgi:hypothetical protein
MKGDAWDHYAQRREHARADNVMDMSPAVEGVIGGLVSVRKDRNGYSARASVLVVGVVVALLGTTANAPVRVGRVGAGDLAPGTLVAGLVFGFRC